MSRRYRLISADSHVTEPPDLWTTRVPASLRDRANGLQDAPWPPVYPKMPGEPSRVAPSRAKKKK